MLHNPLKDTDLYPLADALGAHLRITKDGSFFRLTLERIHSRLLVLKDIGLDIAVTPKLVDAIIDPVFVQTTGVLLQVLGDLHIALTIDHKRNQLELVILDHSKLEKGKPVFEKAWSRLRFAYAVRHAVVKRYTAEPSGLSWEETPDAKGWFLDYLVAREEGKMDSSEALELADALSINAIERCPNMYKRWQTTTRMRRDELMADAYAAKQSVQV